VEDTKSGIKLFCDFFKAIETVEAVLKRTAKKHIEMLTSGHDCSAVVHNNNNNNSDNNYNGLQ